MPNPSRPNLTRETNPTSAEPSAENNKRGAARRGRDKTASPPNLKFERSRAIVIGINNYGDGIPQLKTAGNDARQLAEILSEDYGYDEVDLLVEDVTLARLQTLLDDLPAKVGVADRLVFYFAGHGIALDGDDGPAGYLIPQDARSDDRETFLPMQFLHEKLTALPCRHCLTILDCCFSGAFRWASTRSLTRMPEVIHRERYERFIRDPAWQVLTSAAHDQEALDILSGNVIGERETSGDHSPFAQALFDALRGAGDVIPDGVITAAELYIYLRDHVEVDAEAQAQHQQTPSF